MTTAPVPGDSAQSMQAAPILWWQHDEVIRRLICDLITAEFTNIRPSGVQLPPHPWHGSLHLCNDLGADSLELLQLATALADMLHLQESGTEDFLLARPTLADWISIAQAALRRFDAALTFRTSGSTGTPKRCSHALAGLWQEVLELATLLPERQRVLSAVPSHHIYGFIFTILLPHALGLAAAEVIDLRGSSPARLRGLLAEGDLVIGHPIFWQAAAPLLAGVASDVVGVSSTAPCPDSLSEALRVAGLGRLLQIFGSSETAGIGWRDLETAPYALFKHWQKDPLHEAMVIRRIADGSIQKFELPDKVAWCEDRFFWPGARRDAAVQVGGINVFPAVVRRALLSHPAVHDAAVRLMRADEGARLKAFIVAHESHLDQAALHQALEDWVQQHLTPPERPRAFTFGAQCPVGPDGKDADWII